MRQWWYASKENHCSEFLSLAQHFLEKGRYRNWRARNWPLHLSPRALAVMLEQGLARIILAPARIRAHALARVDLIRGNAHQAKKIRRKTRENHALAAQCRHATHMRVSCAGGLRSQLSRPASSSSPTSAPQDRRPLTGVWMQSGSSLLSGCGRDASLGVLSTVVPLARSAAGSPAPAPRTRTRTCSSLITLARRKNPPGNELRQDGVTCPPTHTRVHC